MSRGTAWSDGEVRALISIWGDSRVQEELDGAVRNKTIYVGIQKKLAELGYERDWQQCKSKIKNMKSDYRKVKDNNGETGRGRKTCKFYNEIDCILGHRPASTPTSLLDTGTTTEYESQQSEPEEGDGHLSDESDIQAQSSLDSNLVSTEATSSAEPNDPPAKKKQKVEKVKKSKGEKAMDRAISEFMKFQKEADERFHKLEEERQKREAAMEEKRQRDEREHEMRMFQLLGRMMTRDTNYSTFTSPHGNFSYHEYDDSY